MMLQDIIQMDKEYFMNVFGDRIPVSFKYGKGINLWDSEDKMYYDFLAGIAVSALGHSHPQFITALKAQLDSLIHTSSLYYIESQSKLAKMLVENSCADKVFFANSGAEANEGAIKLARIYYKKKEQPHKYEIITLKNSFHGRTMTTVAATGQEKYQKPYAPLTPGFKHVERNDIDALKNAVTPSTCAIMLELIQGESGVNLVSKEYLLEVKKICAENDLLLIFDEIQTGMGRTGKLFAYQHYNIEPDIFTLAKALGGGIPIGAVCAKQQTASAFEPGDHGSTFGGNPFSCTAGLNVMDILLNDGLVQNASDVGQYFITKLQDLMAKQGIINEVRGIGLMVGIEFKEDISKELMKKLFEKGFLVGSVGTKVLRFLPPLVVTKEDIDKLVEALDEILS
ncbi:aspartate aminotransferase family protein [Petroclostridium sp. X23]|uniref:aspartate aminotransferase family protein n=1 Tax=Petroclostridium sp. X23 TaxID=3045146 RepID=UPI0024ACEFD0|nr:aspartate aminotransferase family protein [Petroclostridium sp. X23]WHH58405.1 aspartate aminotransferase family protein [Petroclostridium sp. X23]